MIANPNKVAKQQLDQFPIKMLDDVLPQTTDEVHLGIHRNEKGNNQKTVNARISSARRATYKLMKSGVHGFNGLNPSIAYSLFCVYIVPV